MNIRRFHIDSSIKQQRDVSDDENCERQQTCTREIQDLGVKNVNLETALCYYIKRAKCEYSVFLKK